MNDNIIEVKGLKKYFFGGEIKALDGVDLDIDQMEKDFKKLMAFWKSVYLRKE